MTDPQRKRGQPTLSPWLVVGAASEVGFVTAFFSVGGWWLDQRWGTTPWLMLIGLSMALIAGFYRLWKIGSRFFKEEAQSDRHHDAH